MMSDKEKVTRLIALAIVLYMFVALWPVAAAPPHPDLLNQTAAGKKAVPFFMSRSQDLREAGINSGSNAYEPGRAAAKTPGDRLQAVIGEFNVLAILVQFSDNSASTASGYFDNIMFNTSTTSVRHYYRNASFGQLDIITVNLPSSLGWRTAPQTYAYYVNNESGVNPDSYPRNSQGLVEDLVVMIDPVVDFSVYDNDDDGFVDVLMVIHAGPGAEFTGSDADMWSHQWYIYPMLTNDGAYVSSFTVQPEYLSAPSDMTIGVFAHELGHAFGLPDLYDTDYSSQGIGSWGLMAYGSWLGPYGMGGLPSHPCAWSRIQMGFLESIRVTTNVNSQSIEDIKTSGDVYRLWTSGSLGNEYFLVENRQSVGYDSYLPGSGLLIWHIDEAMESNDNEWVPGMNPANHYLVALEQCDGAYGLELNVDLGNSNDVFPGTGSGNSFNALSATNSNSYTTGPTSVAVENISAPASSMAADLRVSLAGGTDDGSDGDGNEDILPSTLTLSQNYPNPFNPTTTIAFYSPDPGQASVEIINPLGYRVKTLFDDRISSGVTELTWDGTNAAGAPVASGIYLYKVEVNGQKKVKKMVLVR
ncbi:MAG: M6 family metalloprotease domain-containing protein [Candidatus Zixiibacteriota bacterium]|nr:MAG: M6 family metalloprotease domain-containing protein [candidate division Zixibacteria bacterium]